MLIRNNRGELIGEINTIVHEGVVLTSNTVYSQDGERVVTQTITSRDSAGTVRTETFYGGKLLP